MAIKIDSLIFDHFFMIYRSCWYLSLIKWGIHINNSGTQKNISSSPTLQSNELEINVNGKSVWLNF